MSPRVSIVLPTVGRLELLRGALDSALRQSDHFGDYEIIVLDNCSSDGTWDYLQRLEDRRVRTSRAARRLSQSQSWNEAVRASTGEFVYVLQDDNILLPEMLATTMSALSRHAGADLAYFAVRYVNSNGRPRPTSAWEPAREELLPAPQALMRFAREFTVATSFMVFSRAAFERGGGFAEQGPRYPVMLDIEFILRAMVHCNTVVLPASLAMHRVWKGTETYKAAWSPDMFTAMTYMVARVFRCAWGSGQLDAQQLEELREALCQTFLLDIFKVFAKARRHAESVTSVASGS